ncbi:DUF1878 family protein [Peribacillus frigoritolerans]|uniref:DUF1878 family protein n=1 Tax=Peribacillus frigoritolerans TaxID=450367 RepID=UPI00228115DE|nr:DUF1878 family protein [Peribacillus frigoritolerans]MCY9007177.1 DUF1878 family protein [Peribacillus frigoritolerans]
MSEDYQKLIEKIELLEWKVEILQDNVTCKSFFNILLEMNITKQQHSQIVDLIQKYSDDYKDNWDSKKYSRYSFEKEMAQINDQFEMNTQAIEIILQDLAEAEDDENYKLLFVRLYSHMPKYKDVFPEIKQRA